MAHKLINGVRVPVELPKRTSVFKDIKAAAEASRVSGAIDRARKQVGTTTKKPTLKQAIASLRHDDDAHWTKTGLPDLRVLSELTGLKLQRAYVEKVAAGFNRKDAEFAAKKAAENAQ